MTEEAPGRYHRHDLLRAHALELTLAQDTEEDRRAACHGLLDRPRTPPRGRPGRSTPWDRPRWNPAAPACPHPVARRR
ncbi:hypothetical protein [Streptomyces lonegramiae]|uniref:Uncharacterized protein n=1 Tax=Streptomyces lonegramiae TaxID=3075524 RepID=A0ABU2X7U5_9ACTN|nr:hypothetical protein [Streptomyces sp. DSM 41529]MDT0542002.1 hypothetical protein [Streptomyces sp. DSM 41529]